MTAQPPIPGPQPHAKRPAPALAPTEPPHPGSSPQRPATPPTRHRPLTDEPSAVTPTPAGLNYLANRRQQHPKTTSGQP